MLETPQERIKLLRADFTSKTMEKLRLSLMRIIANLIKHNFINIKVIEVQEVGTDEYS